MSSRAFNVVVVLFWIATMSWLVVAKILPPLQIGEPPNYSAILAEEPFGSPVCWLISVKGHPPFGWAASKVVRHEDKITEVYSRAFFSNLPLDQIAPGLLGAIVRPVLRHTSILDMDTRSRTAVDPMGRLVSFTSKVRLATIADAITIRGQMDDSGYLKLQVQSGELRYETKNYLPSNALIEDELSPQAKLPGIRVGQTWTVPVYSPFRPLDHPIEILQATVERSEKIRWHGSQVECRLVVYRSDSGSGLTAARETRGRFWVDRDGQVLQQEIAFFNAQLVFVRAADPVSEQIADELGDDWSGEMSSWQSNAVLKHAARSDF